MNKIKLLKVEIKSDLFLPPSLATDPKIFAVKRENHNLCIFYEVDKHTELLKSNLLTRYPDAKFSEWWISDDYTYGDVPGVNPFNKRGWVREDVMVSIETLAKYAEFLGLEKACYGVASFWCKYEELKKYYKGEEALFRAQIAIDKVRGPSFEFVVKAKDNPDRSELLNFYTETIIQEFGDPNSINKVKVFKDNFCIFFKGGRSCCL